MGAGASGNYAGAVDDLVATLTNPADLSKNALLPNSWQNFARFRLYRHRSLQVNSSTKYAFFSIFLDHLQDYLAEISKLNLNLADFATFAKRLLNFHKYC